jgi:hypothetical protein
LRLKRENERMMAHRHCFNEGTLSLLISDTRKQYSPPQPHHFLLLNHLSLHTYKAGHTRFKNTVNTTIENAALLAIIGDWEAPKAITAAYKVPMIVLKNIRFNKSCSLVVRQNETMKDVLGLPNSYSCVIRRLWTWNLSI